LLIRSWKTSKAIAKPYAYMLLHKGVLYLPISWSESWLRKNTGRNGYRVTAIPLILCIDDEALGLQIRKAVLERAGYRVVTAQDGNSGLNFFTGNTVDAVILDYSMPGMNGGEVAIAMRKFKAATPILLLSAYVDLPPEVVRSVSCILTKGDGPTTLIEKVQEMLASNRANSEDSR
jgi:CheY-like chemotaxis protein